MLTRQQMDKIGNMVLANLNSYCSNCPLKNDPQKCENRHAHCGEVAQTATLYELLSMKMERLNKLEKVVKPILDCDVIFHKGEEVWSSGLMEREVRNGKNEVVATTFTPDCATGIMSCHNAVLESQETAKAEGLIEECKGKRID